MIYTVKLDTFEGPFDLLVYLIENAKMSIYDIRITEITNQYIAYIEKAKMLDVALASEFLTLAAALVEIKSKMLLPRIKIDETGNMEFEDPRNELVSRLLEYKRFKNAAELLEKSEELALCIFEKPKEDISQYTNEPDIYLSLDIKHFVAAFNQFLLRKKRLEEIRTNYEKPEEPKTTAEEKIDFIKSIFKIKNKRTVNFRDLLQFKNDKYEIALTFASILEMAKQGSIRLKQPVPFGDIKVIENTEGDKRNGEQENVEIGV